MVGIFFCFIVRGSEVKEVEVWFGIGFVCDEIVEF